jgi:hypothetical protein
MIQRIQTVYLFFVFCLMATLVFIPFSPASSDYIMGLNTGFFAAVALLAIITVFLYRKRNLQIRICHTMLSLLVLIYAFNFIFDRQLLPLSELFQRVHFTFVFPLIAFIFTYLAILGIRKDEKLVRSLDRLR